MKKSLSFLLVFIVLLCFASMAQATSYAVVFSGGYNQDNNFDRYYEETLRMWTSLTTTLNYDVSNVYVLFADGTNTAPDRSSGVNSDWSMIESAGGNIQSAYESDLENVLTTLGSTMATEDDFYFWSFDHGANTDPPNIDNTSLIAWQGAGGDGYIQDDQFASWVNPFNVNTESYVFGQCYAGGMVDDLGITDGDGRFATWAADWYEPSYGSGYVDAWADGIDAGLTNTIELAEYAIANDPFAPPGYEYQGETYIEHPGYTGASNDIYANSVPEPSTIVLFGLGILGLAGYSRRKE